MSYLIQDGFVKSNGQVISIEISHQHDHSKEHHSHEMAESAHDHHHDKSDESADQSSGPVGETHSHTVLVSVSPSVILAPNILISFARESSSTLPERIEANRPIERCLDSLFRPPILV